MNADPRHATLRVPIIRIQRTALYFQRVFLHGARIEFCVANWQADPKQYVASTGPDGTIRHWHRRDEGDLLVFTSPDDYDGYRGLQWCYDPIVQAVEKMPEVQAQRAAMCNRVSA